MLTLTLTFEVLDNITIEGQRIARMANLLGFGGSDVKDSNLMDGDLDWLLADGGEVVNFHEEQVGIPPEDKEAEVPFGPGEGVLGVGQQLEDCTLSELSLDELAYKRTMVGATQAKAVEDAAAKADVTKAMLLRKIYRFQEFLQRVKRGPFTV
jgi:hypothetical protein